ncbi:MAG: ParB/RepB/Spo0J family partition protein [Patescibacteria group bacterium]|jgi:ParB family chromosome partitioning protein
MANGLGRGLSSLIPQKVKKVTTAAGETVVDVSSDFDRDKVLHLAPEKISVNPQQPRKDFNEKQLQELMESISQYGIIQPLVITRAGNKYELIAGERRLRAARALGLKEVPAIVREAGEQEKLELALIENIQREDLNPIELALSYRKLIDEFNITHEELGRRIGKSRPVISNTLRFLGLPEKIQEAITKGDLNSRHAIALAGLDSPAKQMALFERIMKEGLNTVDVFKEVQTKFGGSKESRIKADPRDQKREEVLQKYFGTRAEIQRTGKGGRIIITYYGDEMLDDIIDKIGGID